MHLVEAILLQGHYLDLVLGLRFPGLSPPRAAFASV
jgi:hypothetical protein